AACATEGIRHDLTPRSLASSGRDPVPACRADRGVHRGGGDCDGPARRPQPRHPAADNGRRAVRRRQLQPLAHRGADRGGRLGGRGPRLVRARPAGDRPPQRGRDVAERPADRPCRDQGSCCWARPRSPIPWRGPAERPFGTSRGAHRGAGRHRRPRPPDRRGTAGAGLRCGRGRSGDRPADHDHRRRAGDRGAGDRGVLPSPRSCRPT
ncbi:MAG: hypothetical protein ACJA1L_003615, partial [Paracoccaceae bacterium]